MVSKIETILLTIFAGVIVHRVIVELEKRKVLGFNKE